MGTARRKKTVALAIASPAVGRYCEKMLFLDQIIVGHHCCRNELFETGSRVGPDYDRASETMLSAVNLNSLIVILVHFVFSMRTLFSVGGGGDQGLVFYGGRRLFNGRKVDCLCLSPFPRGRKRRYSLRHDQRRILAGLIVSGRVSFLSVRYTVDFLSESALQWRLRFSGWRQFWKSRRCGPIASCRVSVLHLSFHLNDPQFLSPHHFIESKR